MPTGRTPGAGELLLLVGSSISPNSRGRRKRGWFWSPVVRCELDQHLVLVDHVGEFEPDPVRAGPGDARRNAGRAASEHHLAADRRHRLAFDQGALARKIAQPRVDLADSPSEAWPRAGRAPAWPGACPRPVRRRNSLRPCPLSSWLVGGRIGPRHLNCGKRGRHFRPLPSSRARPGIDDTAASDFDRPRSWIRFRRNDGDADRAAADCTCDHAVPMARPCASSPTMRPPPAPR